MTAPDQPDEHALRDKVRDTIHPASPTCIDYHAADCDLCAEQADAVMAVVQPVIDAKDAEIEALKAGMASTASDALDHRLCGMNLGHAIRRAEDAERELAALRAHHQQIGDQ